MKRLILLIILLTCSTMLTSQEEAKSLEPNFVLGGSISFFTQNNTYPLSSVSLISGIGGIYSSGQSDSKNTQFSFSPYVGKIINSKFIVGLQLQYGSRRYSTVINPGSPSPSNLVIKSYQGSLGFFARYTINPDKALQFYIQPYLEYNKLYESETSNTVDNELGFIELGSLMGLLYHFNSRLRATLTMGGLTYVNGKWTDRNTSETQTFNSLRVSSSLSNLRLGIEIRL